MSDTDEVEATVRIEIGTDSEGSMVMVVTANPDDTTPSAYVKLWVNPDTPNSYEEFEAVSTILTDSFLKVSGDAMREWIATQAEVVPPEQVAAVEEQVNSGMLLQGFTPEQVAEIARLARGDS